MLCLSRKVGEAIYIDGKIKVCVLHVRDGRVMIGIEAPKDVLILREELIEDPPQEKPRAA